MCGMTMYTILYIEFSVSNDAWICPSIRVKVMKQYINLNASSKSPKFLFENMKYKIQTTVNSSNNNNKFYIECDAHRSHQYITHRLKSSQAIRCR